MGLRGGLGCRIGALLLAGSLAACGSSSSSKPSRSAVTGGSTPAKPASSGRQAGSTGASVTSGPVHAVLHGPNHRPVVGKPWPYSVRVTDASGRPLSGTVRIQFTFAGQVVGADTPPVHPVKRGVWHDNLTFPKQAIGEPVVLQAVVHTSAGSVTLNWPVTARQ